MDMFTVVITWQVWLTAIVISVIVFIGLRVKKRPTGAVQEKRVYPIKQKVLDAKPESPYSVYEGYALYCTNKDMYLRCIDNSTYDWVETLRDAEDFFLKADGEPKPVWHFHKAISNFVGSLHCVLVPCKLYTKNYPNYIPFAYFKNMTYRGRFTEPDFNKSMDFHVYYERMIEESSVPEEAIVSSSISTSLSNPLSKKSGPPRPRPPPPPRPRPIPPKSRIINN